MIVNQMADEQSFFLPVQIPVETDQNIGTRGVGFIDMSHVQNAVLRFVGFVLDQQRQGSGKFTFE